MSKTSHKSKVLAVLFVILTVCIIGSTITMVILYKTQLAGLDPTPRPTIVPTTEQPPPKMRLPKNLVPINYKVTIQPQLYTRLEAEGVNATTPNQTLVFNGSSTVYFQCVQTTSSIFLHSLNLNLSEPVVRNTASNHPLNVAEQRLHEDESNFLEITLNEALKENETYSLFYSFNGDISKKLVGLYLSSYEEVNGENEMNKERFLAATNMEPTDTRRLFPCFDEPEMKAVFDVTVIHRKNTKALSNGAEKEHKYIDGWMHTVFHPTQRMSTYLFALTVSEFIEPENSETHEVKIHTYARPEAIAAEHAKFAANVTSYILDYFSKRFGITYPMAELDQIALPDLSPLAMENWGLVTYQEGSLLYEEGVSSEFYKEAITNLIAHELAHQWFGNLVTMKWWNNIWLNEGFATYMSIFATDYANPSYKAHQLSVMQHLHTAFEEDALVSSHPLIPPEEDVQTTSEIVQLFDSITYSKGAMLLRMLADIIEEDKFNQGVNNYLKAFMYKTTDQYDLWEYLQKSIHGETINVTHMMESWTKQIGYPVIYINTTTGDIYQKHFLFNESSESSLWWEVHITYMKNSSKSGKFWLLGKDKVRKPELELKNGEWLLANINCAGYYRVNYNEENWEALLAQLEENPELIPVLNRWQLIDDAFNLARAKLVSVTVALNSTRFLKKETEYLPWESLTRNIEYFIHMFDRSEVYGPMQAYLQQQVSVLFDYFYKNKTSNLTSDYYVQRNKILAVNLACSSGYKPCTDMATKEFTTWMEAGPNGTNSIETNLRSTIYCYAIAMGGKKEWEFAWEKFQKAVDPSEADQLRYALSCTKKIWLLNRYLDYTLDPEVIRLMDVTSTINYIAQNVAGQALAWNFIRANWEYVREGNEASLIMGVTQRFSTPFELSQLEQFAAENDPPILAMEQAIEQTRVNIKWVNEHKDIVLNWFESQTV